MLKKLDNQNFENEVLNNEGTALVDFYADWCGPCKMVAPIIEEIANEREDITVGKINVDENPELAIKYGVSSIPTILVFKEGKEDARLIGFRDKSDYLKALG
jgi:thioredoxin 1